MNKNSYSFKLGNFACWVIKDGICPVPATVQIPSFQGKSVIKELDINILLIKTLKNLILIDTGLGAGMDPNSGRLIQNLQREGIQCQDIDTIVFSHGHGDHIGGNMDSKGNPVFSNARYFMFRKEWEFWTSRSGSSNMPEDIQDNILLPLKKNLFPLKDKMNLFEGNREIIPGISYIETPGHTPGHIALVISSGGKRLLCFCDAFHRPIEIENPDLFRHPPMTGEAAASRAKILYQVKPSDLIFGVHFPFPGLGYISYKDKDWHWQPIINH
jgi:glyoxylase-like metal-dependent hydrolase (beta-lactamase superfamily II)